jgi:putative nucleotidyltransferase with HDIG domain
MLKRIPVEQLRLGMHLHALCGSWMDHPFWRSKFVLTDPKDLERIQDTGIREAWIDTERGLDVARGVEAVDADKAAREAEQALQASVVAAASSIEPTTMAEELGRAQAVMRQSREKVVSMFSDARLGKAVDAQACLPMVEEISDSVSRNPNALVNLARLKRQDDYTYMHSVAVCALMVALAHRLGLAPDQAREAGMAGMLHDIGKAKMPLDVLNKPGRLTDLEFDVMRSHPERGWELLEAGGGASEVALDVCLHHHERIDGTGYPHKLAGDQISLFARMGAVCDVYDAITSDRPYKRGWGPGEAIRQMVQWKGHFDPVVFQAFVKTVGIYPVGTVVRLASGRLAVVTRPHETDSLTPVVKAFFSTKSGTGIVPQEIDLADGSSADRIVAVEPADVVPGHDVEALWLPPGVKPLR